MEPHFVGGKHHLHEVRARFPAARHGPAVISRGVTGTTMFWNIHDWEWTS